MKKQKKSLFREAKSLIVQFFKPYGLKDSMLDVPESIKRMGLILGLFELSMTIISLAFSFLLKGTNMLIEHKLILLGIMLFCLYRAQAVVRQGADLLMDGEYKKSELIFQNEVILRGSKLLEVVANKVMIYDPKTRLFKQLQGEFVMNPIKRYLGTLWKLKVRHKFDVIELISVIAMLAFAIATNDSISQFIYIPLILSFVLISFLSSAYVSLKRDDYFEIEREVDDKESVIVNDLLRVSPIVKHDFEMRIKRFQCHAKQANENTKGFHKKLNFSRLLVSSLELASQWGFIVFYLLNIKWSSISINTIAEIIASLAVVETALSYVGRIADTMSRHREQLIMMEKETPVMEEILAVYHKETESFVSDKPVEVLSIPEFLIKYPESSANDVPFELISSNPISIKAGEVAILYGASGSGKSTFEKMLSGRIALEKSTDIPSTTRFMFYDETLRFGSLSLYEELFCGEASPSLAKMQEILENLHLWNEIQNNCLNVWEWLKTKNFTNSLSNGQKQRLILAKMLYWMDSDIDVLILDEATSGLDDRVESDNADAEKILEYIVKYANKDKKRIIVISTHQNIDGFIANLESEYTFKSFFFEKDGDKNVIKEV